MVKSYKDLNVWKKGIAIVDNVYVITDKFPRQEQYGLVAQMRRCAVSIPSNIAEGFVRHHSKEYKQFLYVSLGSCAELETQLIIGKKRKYVTSDAMGKLEEDLNHESKMLMNLIKCLH
ncbi:MAG: four helix bundle protein [Omnitrophica bacterium]|nr:four helix bundle protein [Candidatus Omnitrophota bacterium]